MFLRKHVSFDCFVRLCFERVPSRQLLEDGVKMLCPQLPPLSSPTAVCHHVKGH